MAKGDTKMIYDSEEDILSLSRGRKVKASIDIGDFIVDVDHKGFVAGIEILNASENLDIPAETLESLRSASMNISYKTKFIVLSLVMKFANSEKSLAIPLTVDLGHKGAEHELFAVA